MGEVATSASLESPKELTPIQRWKEEIKMAEQELNKFHERGRRVNKRFLDERDMMDSGNKWFNVFYTNTNILESALYAQLPKPAVSRRFKDYRDDTARVAALIIERSITQDLDDPRDTFDSTMRAAVQDRLIPGLSAAWLRLETDTAEIPYVDETADQSKPKPPKDYVPLKQITDQRICVDYVYWQDFIWSPCRIWEERRWVGRKVYMDKDAMIARFGEEKARQVPLDYTPQRMDRDHNGMTPKFETLKKACIYEIWDRTTKKVFWFSKSFDQMLDEKDDPLKLVGFEPCPRPMLANITTSNTVPRPDYYMVQDQYQELDNLNNRISMLLQACKVVGTYDRSAEGVSRMLQEGFDNQLIPVDNWAGFAEKGGLKGTIDWLPLEVVVQALIQLTQNREMVKAQIYELTGISDIVRGATKASETLGAQELKSKFASIAIKKRQDEVARFAGDILRIKAEIQVKHFDPQILIKKSNIEATGPENMALVEPAMQMLGTEEGFEWRIQVTADSIAQADYAMEKADRIEFLTAASTYIEKASAMLQGMPKAAPMLVSLLKWGIAGFRNTSEIEGMLDAELDKMQDNGTKDAEPEPSPEQLKAQAEQKKIDAELQADQQRLQMEQQAAEAEAQRKERMAQAELQHKERLFAMEIQMKQMELQFKEQELQMKAQQMGMQLEFKQAEMELNQEGQAQEHEMNMEAQAQQHEMNLAQGAESHEANLEQGAAASEAKIEQTKAAAKAAPAKKKEK